MELYYQFVVLELLLFIQAAFFYVIIKEYGASEKKHTL